MIQTPRFLFAPSFRRGLGAAVAVSALLAALAHADPAPAPAAPPALAGGPPPTITVLQRHPGLARGLIFVAPKTTAVDPGPQGPEIIDNLGRPIWFHPTTNGDQAADFRVQNYRGESVLTFWQGQSHTGPGHGEGVDYIYDHAYRLIATVNAGNGLVPWKRSRWQNDSGCDLPERWRGRDDRRLSWLYRTLSEPSWYA